MASNHCSGHVTFNEIYHGATSEWPENLPGYICKTPPVGPESAPRLAQCCSGPVYNITSPTSPDDPAYPVTCATLCQVDPAFDAKNESNPFGWSDFFMCLTDGGKPDGGGVNCDTVTVKGEPAPTSFSSTPSGSWLQDWTSYWTYESYSDDLFGHWMEATAYGEHTTKTVDGTVTPSTTTATPSETASASTSSETEASLTIGSSPSSSISQATETLTGTSDSGRLRLRLSRVGAVLLVVCFFGAGWPV
ncbi:hypothetical protein ASPVEDRAFT_41819 [Aspergillus versicolor CBS 583.65]|uniref:Uncharacterized protein n=1 Tax=Aspergillus versicolor CBS 583.65 TaxID=1036611 RepID=A0A1L9PLL0_ASPVE|nr:uncharacterized protein ASPVEDRAFT_41819 [Aspergillus versicolor CBS 583.65]OJJ02326.1 hypothetical protein ASPVEDRAFT_41819 [Aspergillus versicolor CBS 583.65]